MIPQRRRRAEHGMSGLALHWLSIAGPPAKAPPPPAPGVLFSARPGDGAACVTVDPATGAVADYLRRPRRSEARATRWSASAARREARR